MAKLKPKDKVEWRAGTRPSLSRMRKGVIKEILPEGIALVRTRVDGVSRLEEIRVARLRPVEEPPKAAPKKRAKRTKKKRGPKKAAGKKAPAKRGRKRKAAKRA